MHRNTQNIAQIKFEKHIHCRIKINRPSLKKSNLEKILTIQKEINIQKIKFCLYLNFIKTTKK